MSDLDFAALANQDPGPGLLEPGPAPTGAEGVAEGSLRLIPGEVSLGPGADGNYRVQVSAFWFEGDHPDLRREPLGVEFVAQPAQPDFEVSPSHVEVAAGEMRVDALVTSRQQGDLELTAFFPGGVSTPSRLHFVPSRPTELKLLDVPPSITTLSVATLLVTAGLRDISRRPTVADRELTVSLTAAGDAGTETAVVQVPAGQGQARVPIELKRFGAYELSIRADGLEGDQTSVRVAFDLAILLWAAAGGLLGGLVPLLRAERRRKIKAWQVVRGLVLAVIAAVVLLLMSTFGLVDWLTRSDPGGPWGALTKLSLSSQTAAFLLGFVAGFVGDWFYEWLRGALAP